MKQVQELKLGYRLDKECVTPEVLRKRVWELLLDDEIAKSVKSMSIIMRESGGAKRAAEFVEEYITWPIRI